MAGQALQFVRLHIAVHSSFEYVVNKGVTQKRDHTLTHGTTRTWYTVLDNAPLRQDRKLRKYCDCAPDTTFNSPMWYGITLKRSHHSQQGTPPAEVGWQ